MRAKLINEDFSNIKQYVASGLKKIHDDFKSHKIIGGLHTYDVNGTLSTGYLRKLIEMGILTNVGTSRKTSRYEWTGPQNPNYDDLATKVISFKSSSRLPLPVRIPKIPERLVKTIVNVTLRLNKLGVSEDNINDEILNLLSKMA